MAEDGRRWLKDGLVNGCIPSQAWRGGEVRLDGRSGEPWMRHGRGMVEAWSLYFSALSQLLAASAVLYLYSFGC